MKEKFVETTRPEPKDTSTGAAQTLRRDNFWQAANRLFYQKWSNFAAGPGGAAFVFGWAVAEATFWPVIPDFALAPLEVMNRHPRSLRLLLASAAGSAFGSLLLFGLARRNPARTRRVVARLPLVHAYHFDRIEQKLTKNWVQTLVMQPWSGVPAKIVVTVGAEKGLLSWTALPVLALARAVRMAAVVAVARLLARSLGRPLRSSSLLVFCGYLLFFFPVWWQIVKDRSKSAKL